MLRVKTFHFSHRLRDNLACLARFQREEKWNWAREKYEGRSRKEEVELVLLYPSPTRSVSRLNFLSISFRTPATQAKR